MPVRVLFLLLPLVAHAEPGPRPRVARFDRHGDLLPAGVVARLGVPPVLSGLTADIAWTPDSKQVVAADWTSITRFDAATGRPVETIKLDGLHRSLFAALAGDGRTLFRAAGSDCTLTDTATGGRLTNFELFPPALDDPARKIQSLSLSADHRFLAGTLGARGGPAVAWRYDLAHRRSGRILAEWANLRSVRLSPDGRRAYAVAGSESTKLIGHDLRAGRDLWAVPLDRPGTVRAVSPDGRRLVLTDGTHFRVFDTAAGKEVAVLPYPMNPFFGLRPIDLSPDGRLLAVADDATVTVYDVAAAKVRHKFAHPARLVAFSPDGKSLLSANAWVQRWDLATGKPMYPEPTASDLNEPAPRLHWSGDGRRLLVIRPALLGEAGRNPRNADLSLWDADAMTIVWRTALPIEPMAVMLDRTGDVIRVCTAEHRLMTWTAGSPKPSAITPLAGLGRTFPRLVRTDFLPDGRLLVPHLVGEAVVAQMFDAAGQPVGQPVPLLRQIGPGVFAGSVAFWRTRTGFVFADGRQIDAVTGRGRPPLWPGVGFEEVRDLPAAALIVTGPGPKAQADRGGPLATVRDGETGRLLGQLRTRFLGPVSPDCRWIAAPAESGVHLLDLRELLGLGLGPQVRHRGTGQVTAAAFAPDARRLATAQADGTVLIWDLPTPVAEPWTAADADRLWADLANDEPKTAWLALWHLLDHPAEATALLRARLRPVPEVKDVTDLIAKLDHPRFPVREAATRSLAEHGEVVEGDLIRALTGAISAEQQERMEGLLKKLDPTLPPAGGMLRGIRCVWLLDRLGTPEAKKVLAELATGAPGSRVTNEARAALR